MSVLQTNTARVNLVKPKKTLSSEILLETFMLRMCVLNDSAIIPANYLISVNLFELLPSAV